MVKDFAVIWTVSPSLPLCAFDLISKYYYDLALFNWSLFDGEVFESNRKNKVDVQHKFLTEFNCHTVKLPDHQDTSINHTVLSFLPIVIVAVPLYLGSSPSTLFVFALQTHKLSFSLFLLYTLIKNPMLFPHFRLLHVVYCSLIRYKFMCYFMSICISAVAIYKQRQSFVLSWVLHSHSCSFVLTAF